MTIAATEAANECFPEYWNMMHGLMDGTFLSPVPEEKKRRVIVATRSKVDSLLNELKDRGWEPGLTEESYELIIEAGITRKNQVLAAICTELAFQQKPLTLRGLLYRKVSSGSVPSTDPQHYNRIGRLMTRLREAGVVAFNWLVDNLRVTQKPSSWSGLNEFVDTVREAYRKDFWASLPEYVHIFCEKDAIAGTIAPVTTEYDVHLSPIRGYTSLSFANEIAQQWRKIEKPIHAYYVGDFDPSGFDLERDVKEKLLRYCGRPYYWTRLGVNYEDFDEFDLIPLKPKKTDRRYQAFVDEHGKQCAEVDAIPPNQLRKRIREAIESHIPPDQWERLKTVEKAMLFGRRLVVCGETGEEAKLDEATIKELTGGDTITGAEDA